MKGKNNLKKDVTINNNEYNNYKKKKISLNKNLLQRFTQPKLLSLKITMVHSTLRKFKRVNY